MPPSRNPGRSGVRPRRSYRRHYIRRKKVCRFCVEKIHYIDYKDTRLLSAFNPERSKILPRRISGTCAPCQRRLMAALKRARNIALLPFASG